LRQAGASVLCLHGVGQGCPDLAVGFRGRNYFLEIKDGNLPPSKQKLTEDENEFFFEWVGHYAVVTSAKEALEVLTRG
jgi:hypothetical protein